MRSSRTSPLLGVALSAGLIVTAGCSALPGDSALTSAELRLVSFTSCDEATQELRAATLATLNTAGHLALAAPDTLPVDATLMDAAGAPAAAEFAPNTRTSTDYSGTNVHESGVDEPDLVKTDGRRIVTVHNGVLRVVDAQRRVETGQLALTDPHPEHASAGWWQPSDLLLHGDRALVLMNGSWWGGAPVPLPEPVPEPALDAPQVGQAEPSDVDPDAPVDSVALPAPMPLPVAEIAGPKLLLVDLSGSAPTVISEYAVDGSLLDARAVGQTARVVVRSTPRLDLPHHTDDPAAQQAAIEEADVTAWLPRYEVTTGGTTESGHVDCTAVSHPAEYSGTSMLTVLTFDLTADSLGDGLPVSIVADGDTVYSNGTSLYVASDQRWRVMTDEAGSYDRTAIYKFDVSAPGKPRYVGAGEVDGWLLNQYAMSEWDGFLRVATTSGDAWGEAANSESAVYVLAERDNRLVEVGAVTGLGVTERIYSVRYVGPIAFLVTFRQIDPLYTVDLSDPTAPKVLGELKVTGYSSYLHPIGEDRLLGIGQEADEEGRTLGTQVSLYDVSDLTNPTVLDRFHVPHAVSDAEHDPHAVLWWSEQQLLVVPIMTWGAGEGRDLPEMGALALRIQGNTLTELALVSHPALGPDQPSATINRALVVGDTLWTVSSAGLQANALSTFHQVAWIPFT